MGGHLEDPGYTARPSTTAGNCVKAPRERFEGFGQLLQDTWKCVNLAVREERNGRYPLFPGAAQVTSNTCSTARFDVRSVDCFANHSALTRGIVEDLGKLGQRVSALDVRQKCTQPRVVLPLI